MSKLLVYNIRKEKYSATLKASGMPNRWNRENEFVIYTGSSRALSVLELVVHRSAISIDSSYKILVIEIDCTNDDIESVINLPTGWHALANYSTLQNTGSKWYQAREKLILKVPSAIISKEFNYIINTSHPDFLTKVRIKELENFEWDDRLL